MTMLGIDVFCGHGGHGGGHRGGGGFRRLGLPYGVANSPYGYGGYYAGDLPDAFYTCPDCGVAWVSGNRCSCRAVLGDHARRSDCPPLTHCNVGMVGAADPAKLLDGLAQRFIAAKTKYEKTRGELTSGFLNTLDPTRRGYVIANDRMRDQWQRNYDDAFAADNDEAREIAVQAMEGLAAWGAKELTEQHFTGIAPRDLPSDKWPWWAWALIAGGGAVGGFLLAKPIIVAMISRPRTA